jgi:hypothetical protein
MLNGFSAPKGANITLTPQSATLRKRDGPVSSSGQGQMRARSKGRVLRLDQIGSMESKSVLVARYRMSIDDARRKWGGP